MALPKPVGTFLLKDFFQPSCKNSESIHRQEPAASNLAVALDFGLAEMTGIYYWIA